jgi:hypothetical protein
MTTHDIMQQLERARREATEDKSIEEIPQSELDQIAGAAPQVPPMPFNRTWSKAF